MLEAGEFRGVLHNPVADEECWIVLMETVATKHTGNVETPLTRSIGQLARRPRLGRCRVLAHAEHT